MLSGTGSVPWPHALVPSLCRTIVNAFPVPHRGESPTDSVGDPVRWSATSYIAWQQRSRAASAYPQSTTREQAARSWTLRCLTLRCLTLRCLTMLFSPWLCTGQVDVPAWGGTDENENNIAAPMPTAYGETFKNCGSESTARASGVRGAPQHFFVESMSPQEGLPSPGARAQTAPC